MLWGLLQLATASAIVTETMITAWQPATGGSEPGGSDVVLAPHLHGGGCACTSRLVAQCAARRRCAEPRLGNHLPSRSRGKKGTREIQSRVPRHAGDRGSLADAGVVGGRALGFSQLAEVSVLRRSPAVKESCAEGSLCPAAGANLEDAVGAPREAGSHRWDAESTDAPRGAACLAAKGWHVHRGKTRPQPSPGPLHVPAATGATLHFSHRGCLLRACSCHVGHVAGGRAGVRCLLRSTLP